MSKITVLDENTINQIAAGEVIERPSAVVKELVENAIDAGANAVTVEIKDGGISLIRITDNGSGIEEEDMPLVFLRHSTSKIRTAQDLLRVTSLGFRGEALSSIAAIAQVELVTKTNEAFTGIRYLISGGEEKSLEHIGCPNGTTFIVRNLFYNTPARKKFLKSPVTEAGYISDLMERLVVSHPDVSFKFINNGQMKLHTSGNNNLRDIIYNVYGRDITANLVSVTGGNEDVSIDGYIAKPLVSRGNRNYENYFINGRYIKNNIINKAIEEAFRPFIMLHRYPFTSLHLTINTEFIDVNVHPAKLEVRFKNGEEIYQLVYHGIKNALEGREMIPAVALTEEKQEKKTEEKVPEPFEEKRRREELQRQGAYHNSFQANKTAGPFGNQKPGKELTARNQYEYIEKKQPEDISEETLLKIKETEIGKLHEVIETGKGLVKEETGYYLDKGSQRNGTIDSAKQIQKKESVTVDVTKKQADPDGITSGIQNDYPHDSEVNKEPGKVIEENPAKDSSQPIDKSQNADKPEQLSFISETAVKNHRIIGQVFSTYWIVEFNDKMFLIDQHAAHEKVLYERIMKGLKEKEFSSQIINPPIILSLTLREVETLNKHMESLTHLGFEIAEFGGREYAVHAVPSDLYGLAQNEILVELIDGLTDEVYNGTPEMILEKIASMSCKAAVKGNHKLSGEEAKALIEQLLTLDNPYHCPHGRPTIISMSKYELEKKFKRIV